MPIDYCHHESAVAYFPPQMKVEGRFVNVSKKSQVIDWNGGFHKNLWTMKDIFIKKILAHYTKWG